MAWVASQSRQQHVDTRQNPRLYRGQEGTAEPARNSVPEEGLAWSLEVACAFCLLAMAWPHLALVGFEFGHRMLCFVALVLEQASGCHRH